MNTVTINQNRTLTFEDLKGLRAEAYIRDSTLDQKDGFGPDIQRNNEERFARNYGLVLGDRWYTEFVSGRSVKKRHEFHQFLEDAQMDRFDVLLVDHTSRFGRNQAECIRYKEDLQRLNKIVVFVSQGIISGSDRDFLAERINETLDEQYSRNLSRYVSAGMLEKAQHGLANGPAPFGYKSELAGERRREKKVIDPETMPALVMMLKEYTTGRYSLREVADLLNAAGYRTRNASPFSGYFIRDILANRFYDGKVIFHEGYPDETVTDGIHEVPEEVKRLWNECQRIKREKTSPGAGRPRGEARVFPFSAILKCHYCGQPYYGEAVNRGEWVDLRLTHERRAAGKMCKVWPRSRSVMAVTDEFGGRVVPYLHLPKSWKEDIANALTPGVTDNPEEAMKRARIEKAIENTRKQHKWGDLTDEEYRRERQDLERQLKSLVGQDLPINMPNLERVAEFLEELSTIWSHPGVTQIQREAFIKEVFSEITVGGKQLVSIKPKPEYAPLFASILKEYNKVEYRKVDSPPSPPTSK
ncbi:recombinase family protein [Chloroflexota bacterium]